MISTNTILEVKALPIEEVIGRYVQLKKSGTGLTGCCPFHDEKTASFHVNPAKGIYKCFGCGAGGNNPVNFVIQKTGLPFTEAVERLCADHNITLEHEKTAPEQQAREEQSKNLYQLLSLAQQRYAAILSGQINDEKSPTFNQPLHHYLVNERHLQPDTITQWGMGYVPDFNTLSASAVERGTVTECERAGFIRTTNGKSYDFFHHRVVFPICNVQGQVISFGGRAIADAQPKYLNGSETAVYTKGKHLFGLNHALAELRRTKHAILVEGYMDVIAMHQAGFTHTVGTLGTALTPDQAKLLRRYCSHVTIMRDGDKAGRNATIKDIDILAAAGFGISIIQLAEGLDPDTACRKIDWIEGTKPDISQFTTFSDVATHIPDGIEWRLQNMFTTGMTAAEKAKALREAARFMVDNKIANVERSLYMQTIQGLYKVKAADFKAAIQAYEAELENIEVQEEEARHRLPEWVTGDLRTNLFELGFIQLNEFKRPNYQPGIYFGNSHDDFRRLTNYTIKPLYFVMDPGNERRLIEVYNGHRSFVIELGKKSMVEQGAFETDIVSRPGLFSLAGFGKIQFKHLVNWVNSSTRTVYELKTLGWQGEGFFAFSNKILHNGQQYNYDEYGIATIDERHYLSPGISKIHDDTRKGDNIYENDLYLKHEQATITLTQYFDLFYTVYDEDGMLGIAFIFISAFLDVVGTVTKRPIFYSFGPKDSGKSALSESIMYFFFSGKNSDGKLIQGYNLNPGQGTPFSFFSRAQRFANCPMLFNEYDPNNIEPWKKGAFKSYYDGEGREIGSGDTGKKRKTEIQRWACAAMIVGQYLDTGDEGSIISRSIVNRFSLERNKNRTDAQKNNWRRLSDFENTGISSLLADLYQYRPLVKQQLKKEFWELLPQVNTYFKQQYRIILEARLLNNYTLCLAMVKILGSAINLPFTFQQFQTTVYRRLKMHQELIRDNSILTSFWRDIEVLFDDSLIQSMHQIKVDTSSSIKLKVADGMIDKLLQLGYTHTETSDADVLEFTSDTPRSYLYVRFDAVYDKYAKRYREKTNKQAPNADTLLAYLKDQGYYIGSTKSTYFKDKSTSAYVLDYDAIGINLEKQHHNTPEPTTTNPYTTPVTDDDLPF
jgi:DNA primase catalytic core